MSHRWQPNRRRPDKRLADETARPRAKAMRQPRPAAAARASVVGSGTGTAKLKPRLLAADPMSIVYSTLLIGWADWSVVTGFVQGAATPW